MSFRITKTFRFEAAHRLASPYEGKCASVHGHSFAVEISLDGEGLDERGMVRDFAELAPVKEWIDRNLDHACLLREDDELVAFLSARGQKIFRCAGNPTSEHLASLIFRRAKELLGDGVSRVCVHETCTSKAEYFD